MVNLEEANAFPRRWKHKEYIWKDYTPKEVASKIGYWNDLSASSSRWRGIV